MDPWNELNATDPAADDVLALRELAAQPLMLLMLALFDATSPSCARTGRLARHRQLYERLLIEFARREVGPAYATSRREPRPRWPSRS